VHLLGREAGRGVEGLEELPGLGRLADLLRQLALGGGERLLAGDIELSGGDLERRVGPYDLARLTGQPDVGVVDRQDPHGTGMPDLLPRHDLPVGVAVALHGDPGDLALELRLTAE
jgi:hypothetical protein